MSNTEIQSKVNELRELRRMADELTAEIESIQDAIKAHMTAIDADTLTGADYKITWKTVTSSRYSFGHSALHFSGSLTAISALASPFVP